MFRKIEYKLNDGTLVNERPIDTEEYTAYVRLYANEGNVLQHIITGYKQFAVYCELGIDGLWKEIPLAETH